MAFPLLMGPYAKLGRYQPFRQVPVVVGFTGRVSD